MINPTVKFVKAIESNTFSLTPSRAGRWFSKLLYEFWGFVINGGDDLQVAYGFASGGLNFPSGFTTGSHVLAAGNDGSTSFGASTFFSPTTDFLSLNVTGSLLGKYLVAWQSGSTSTDDGIYKILYVESTNRLILDVTNGATPRRGNKSVFWDRSRINFRIVDIEATTNLAGWSDGQGMTLQFAASDVNPGQANSQFHWHFINSQLSLGAMSISPSGSWTGSDFVDSGSYVSQQFFNSTDGRLLVSLAGGKDFLSCHVNGIDNTLQSTNTPSGFHVEIPKRLYPKENDPNPITFMTWGVNQTPNQVSGTYNTGFYMVGQDGNLRSWTTLVRAPLGDHTTASFSAIGQGIWQGITNSSINSGINYNPYDNTLLVSDGVLHLNQSGQFSFARCRLRRVRFTSTQHRNGDRFGDEWVYVVNGILWPWNNTIMPLGPNWEGT
jgi:hypothetical protein